MKNRFWLFLLPLLFLSLPASATITTDEVYLLNHMNSAAAKAQLGTLVQTAEVVATGDITDLAVTTGKINDLAVTTGKIADANVTVGKLDPIVMVDATGTLTAANIAAMNATPVTLVAAPGAGKLIIVDEIEFFHDYATAAYSSGGDVTIEYETSGVDINVFDVLLVTAGADDNWLVKVTIPYVSTASGSSNFSLTTSVNKAVLITNAVGAFAGGNAANVIKYRIRYHVVTVLT